MKPKIVKWNIRCEIRNTREEKSKSSEVCEKPTYGAISKQYFLDSFETVYHVNIDHNQNNHNLLHNNHANHNHVDKDYANDNHINHNNCDLLTNWDIKIIKYQGL